MNKLILGKNLAKQFTREQILSAIRHIDENNIKLTGSAVYLLEHNNNTYPPKEVIRWAARLAKLDNWENYRLNGGEGTNRPLKDLGFSVSLKHDPTKSKRTIYSKLISEYKEIVRSTGNSDEIYKYYLIADFQNKWDIDSSDFGGLFLSIEFANLIYHVTALTTLKSFATNDPEFLRSALKALSRDEVDLQERVINFCRTLNHRFETLNPTLKGGIDERTVATLLTFINPSNYTFYKWQFYNELCKLLKRKAAKTGECYSDYLQEVNDLIDRYVAEDKELISLHDDFLRGCDFKDNNYYVLAQDILYQTLKERNIDQYRADYLNWLKANTTSTSNKASSYVKALDILTEMIEERIYDVSDLDFLDQLYKDLLKEQSNSEGKYYHVKAPSYGKSGYYSAAIKEYITFHKELLNTQNPLIMPTSPLPPNQILYGPPGTGKTYHTINKAISIANPDFDVDQSRDLVKAEYQRLVEAGQIVFTTFHQSMSYEDFVEGIKPLKPLPTDTFVKYEVQTGIFRNICKEAETSIIQNLSINKSKLPFAEVFEKLKLEWEEDNNLKFPLKTAGYDYTILGFTNTSIQFKKASGGTGHTLSIKTLEDLYYGKQYDFSSGVGIYYPAILSKLESYNDSSKIESSSRVDKVDNYVLIIDEINRGNVSAIFGELITLIEDSKRAGMPEQLEVTLPYSKEKFSVPSNLYIIGTMNTADRSVEALDSALRRRFVFEEMLPDSSVLTEELYGYKSSNILETINQRIELLIDRDHCIGHAYFLGKDEETIVDSFYKNIIPLLQEYFFGDYGKIGLVLGQGFVEIAESKNNIFADFSYDYKEDLSSKPIYRIKDYRHMDNSQVDFGKAIALLMGNA